MKENERLLLFYEECVKKGYSDMTDPQQALKAKVIATDRKLRYGNSIEQFFQKAKAAYEEREAERIAEKQRIAEETRRCAVPGEELVKLHSAPEVISVFKRPDGSFYCTFDKNPERKIEGKPEFRVVPSSTVSYEYHPSETRITMASKGGFTGGQVWETDPWVSRKHEHTGMAFLEITVNEESWEVYQITLSPLVKESFKRYPCYDSSLEQELKSGEIQCHVNVRDSMYYLGFKQALGQNDMYALESSASFVMDEERLPIGQITVIKKLLCKILDGPWPENDEQAYVRGIKLIESDKSSEILEGINLLQEIGENHPRKRSAAELIERNKDRYEAVLQREKEAAIIRKENRQRKRYKGFVIVSSIACVAIILVGIITQVILPKQRYKKAISLIDAGEYDAAYAILEEIGNTEAIVANKYNRAMECIDAQNYETAYMLLDGLDYQDSAQKRKEIKSQYQSAVLMKTDVGGTVFFGTYEQDNNASNGKEDVEWLVLEKKDNRLLVVSQYGLDSQTYNTGKKGATWEACALRQWLNNNFFNSAFSDDEKAMIPEVTVLVDENPNYDTDIDTDTQDRVFLLGISEVNMYFHSDNERECKPTKYALSKDVRVYDSGNCAWWLRTPGNPDSAAMVHGDGSICCLGGSDVIVGTSVGSNLAVRPAMWIDLEA